jgi:membrane protein CcdC involved in cytochrome C biogenesis|tara:strand:+ start:1067 stop:1465 length:399 start_codon:yes stop_codon:yes gene_type:complete
MKYNITNYLLSFIISYTASTITLIYLGVAFNKSNRPIDIPYELFPILLPFMYGIFGIINYYTISNYGYYYSYIIGIIFGLLLSIIGRFGLNLPVKIFNFTKSNEYQVHLYAMLIYAVIFQFIITPLTTKVIG